jgi:hypothetical protein
VGSSSGGARGILGSFELTFLVIIALALAVAVATSPHFLPAGVPRLVQPAATAAVLLVGFAWRPAPGLLAFVIFILVYDTLALPAFTGPTIKRVDEFAIPGLGLVGLARLQPWRTGWRWSWIRDGALGALALIGLVSSLANSVPFTIWVPAAALLFKPFVVLYVASWLPVDRRMIVSGARIILGFGSVVALMGLVEWWAPAAFQQTLGLPEWIRPRGSLPSVKSIFVHPAIFATFTSFLGIFCFVSYVELRNRWLLALGTLFALSTFLTARRRAIFAAGVALVGTFAWYVRRLPRLGEEFRRWLPVFSASTVLVIAFLPGLAGLFDKTIDRFIPTPTPGPTSAPSVPGDDENPNTAPARLALYMGSVEVARDHFPLGAGMGRYGSWMARVEYSPLYREYGLDNVSGLRPNNPQYATDTFWPMVLGEFGVIGLVAYLTFLGWLAVALWRGGRAEPDPLTRAFIVGSLSVLGLAAFESLATPIFTAPPRTYLLFMTIGAATAAAAAARARLTGERAT